MERYLDTELNGIKAKVLLMGGFVDSQLQDSLQALTLRDASD
jgi:phosphate uptake regulator